MQWNIYREVFPTFLAKKSYDWWITRRRMEIYTKISIRKHLRECLASKKMKMKEKEKHSKALYILYIYIFISPSVSVYFTMDAREYI